MFEYEFKNNWYYIFIDNLKWKFWPFKWIFVKNKYLWNINNSMVNEDKYPWYKYSIWLSEDSLFIIWKDKNIEIIKNYKKDY